MSTGRFYRYIYQDYNGFRIIKNNESYGWYDNLPDALYDRDRLESCDWDIEEFVWLPEQENPYKHMDLPPKELDRWRQYIYPCNNGFRIMKRINNKQHYFGTYKTMDEAIRKRNELIEKEWKT